METEVIEEEVTEEIVTEEVIEGDEETPVIEEWMKEDTEDQTSDDLSKTVPTGKFVSLKKKLKGEISEKDQKIAELEAQLKTNPTPKPNTLVKPNRDDFEIDGEYDLAKDRYDEARLEDIYSRKRIKERGEEEVKQTQASIDKAYDDHIERTALLVEKHGISEEKVEIAHNNFKKAMSGAFPKLGDNASKIITSILGKGSERVIYSLGVNKVKRDKLIELAKEDPNGMKLAVFLGEQKQLLNNPKKPQSNAPDPTAVLKGDAPTGNEEKKLKKAYQTAHKNGKTQDGYNARKAGKAAGFDVSKW